MPVKAGIDDAGSDTSHIIEVQTIGQVRKLVLYDRPGDDMQKNKGDLWKIDFSDFHFTDGCITMTKLVESLLLKMVVTVGISIPL